MSGMTLLNLTYNYQPTAAHNGTDSKAGSSSKWIFADSIRATVFYNSPGLFYQVKMTELHA